MDLRDIMFRRMLALPLGYFHDNTTGNLISRFTFDVTQVTSAATNVVTVLVKDSLTIIGLLAYLLYLDWKLTMISLIMVPPIALVVRYFNVRLRNMSRATQQAMGDITQVLQETVECNKVVKIFGGQEYEANRFARDQQPAARLQHEADRGRGGQRADRAAARRARGGGGGLLRHPDRRRQTRRPSAASFPFWLRC